MALLNLAGGLVSIMEPTFSSPPVTDPENRTAERIVDIHVERPSEQSSRLLAAFAALLPDEALRQRIYEELDRRNADLPVWLAGLSDARVRRVVEERDVLRDVDHLFVELVVGDETITIVVSIDNHLGGAAVCAIPLRTDVAALQLDGESAPNSEDRTWSAPNRSVARARLVAARERTGQFDPPLESDRWPWGRSLLEWVVRLLPEGAGEPVRLEASIEAGWQLGDEFLGSPEHDELLDDDRGDFAATIIDFAGRHGSRDLLRWSPRRVEIFLTRWRWSATPGKDQTPSERLDVLRAMIRFCHRKQGVRAARTDETFAAVDQFTPDYLTRVAEAERGDEPT